MEPSQRHLGYKTYCYDIDELEKYQEALNQESLCLIEEMQNNIAILEETASKPKINKNVYVVSAFVLGGLGLTASLNYCVRHPEKVLHLASKIFTFKPFKQGD